ncbi:MAG: DUF4129 domain-containing protein [Chloroflexi bacterium]|nr:DUF4129 domain-containing protein [Chloroflexota bacterium]
MALMGAIWLVNGVGIAQTSIDVDTYWQRLAETEAILASGGDQRQAQIAELWQGVGTVRLNNAELIPIDTEWLFDDDVSRLQARVQAALRSRGQGEGALGAASVQALEQILQDERFQYDPETPLPPGVAEPPAQEAMLPASLSQFILAVLGMLAAVIIVIYIARQLTIQRYEPAPVDPDDDPITSEDAQARASASATVQDYRAAIRYLYLSSLLLLDERNIIHYDPAQTNTEHLRQLRDQPQLYDLLRRIVETFDYVWYGFSPIDEQGYTQFRQNIQQLEGLTTA